MSEAKVINGWTDKIRLKMIERSEFYSEPQVYQYGYYDGFQQLQAENERLRSLIEGIDMIIKKRRINNSDKFSYLQNITNALNQNK